MTSLLLEFQSLKLTEFESTIRSDWPKAMQVGYSLHLYLFKFIQTKAAWMQGNADFESVKMPAAAANHEEEQKRIGMTMAQFLGHLKANDTSVRRRQQN